MYEKRPVKEMHSLYSTYLLCCQHQRLQKRHICIRKETYIYLKRPIKETCKGEAFSVLDINALLAVSEALKETYT